MIVKWPSEPLLQITNIGKGRASWLRALQVGPVEEAGYSPLTHSIRGVSQTQATSEAASLLTRQH